MATPREPKKPNPSAPNKIFVRKDQQAWKRKGWTSAPNSIIHAADMRPEEIWAWVWFASHTNTFELDARSLSEANDHVGRDKAYKIVGALEERGLMVRRYEQTESGVPFIVYDLQPEPVPVEERTAKPKRAKPRKSAFAKKTEAEAVSYTFRKPNVTRQNATSSITENASSDDPGLLHVQETERDQAKRDQLDHGEREAEEGGIPARDVPARAGESYKEDKTNEQDQPTKGEPASLGERGGASGVGWTTSSRDEPASSAGARFLSRLAFEDGTGFPGHAVTALADHVDLLLISGWSEDGITARITDSAGLGKVNNWPGFARRKLEALRPLPSPASSAPPSSGRMPEWCGQCSEVDRRLEGDDPSEPGPECPHCHPRMVKAA